MRKFIFFFSVLFIASFANFSNEKSLEDNINVMSLNIYGWKTMPQAAEIYVKLIKKYRVSIILLQEGVDDWKLTTKMPTDYSRAETIRAALGNCWVRYWQILINQCESITVYDNGRFDLSDGPNATRTGEWLIAETLLGKIEFLNVHWDHQSPQTQKENAIQTSARMALKNTQLLVLAGDFNMPCSQAETLVNQKAQASLQVDGGIDCIFSNELKVTGNVVDASPSDHPAVIANIKN